MNIEKSIWSNGSKKMSLAFPIAKVDKENRTVSGFATLDNLDKHGDVITADASKAAFERFRGNLREMHQPIAVGKVLSFNEEDFYDAESGNNHKGVFVEAYISKGAQDTWEKVLDGTLTGFSIGGNIVEASMEKGDEETDEERRIIQAYDLQELSLVDNPANPLANIFSIQKSGDEVIFKGMAAELETENVFWCKSDQIATSYAGDSKNCSVCGDSMQTIGWVEKYDTEKNSSIKKVVDSYFKKDDAPGPSHGPNGTTDSPSAPLSVTSEDTINLHPDQAGNNIGTTKAKKKKKKNTISKGGSIVADLSPEELEEYDQAEEINEVVEDDEVTDVAADIAEVEVDELDFTKMVTDLKDFVGEKLEKSIEKTNDDANTIRKAFEAETSELAKRFDAVLVEKQKMQKSIDALTELVGELKNTLSETNNRFAMYENDTAIKKSGDLDKLDTKIEKNTSIWQGHFLGVQDL
jgi:Caudovirus prohead serine protease